jgi:hypothetical protein
MISVLTICIYIMENHGQGKDNNNTEEENFASPYQLESITEWWQQYSPLAWSEMYNEYIKYTTSMNELYKEYIKSSERLTELYKELAANTERMTELYKEYVKSTERMTKYWSHKFGNLSSLKKQREKKDR